MKEPVQYRGLYEIILQRLYQGYSTFLNSQKIKIEKYNGKKTAYILYFLYRVYFFYLKL